VANLHSDNAGGAQGTVQASGDNMVPPQPGGCSKGLEAAAGVDTPMLDDSSDGVSGDARDASIPEEGPKKKRARGKSAAAAATAASGSLDAAGASGSAGRVMPSRAAKAGDKRQLHMQQR
jgi:hypothetical protein